jgi:hypothetical protein
MTFTHSLQGFRRWFGLRSPQHTTQQRLKHYVVVKTNATVHEFSRFPRQHLVIVDRPADANAD